jgi:hypothetical protein
VLKALACDADEKRRRGFAAAPLKALACDADQKRRGGFAAAPLIFLPNCGLPR